MCLAVLAQNVHARFPLVLASNRDEFFDRPTEPLHWWTPPGTGEPLLAGRDLRGGGSWMALDRSGRLALLTNVRRPQEMRAYAPSRGPLVTGWVSSALNADDFCTPLATAGHNGFNLLMGDAARGHWHWYAPDQPAPQRLGAGLWGLSNAALDTPWPKLTGLKAVLADALDRSRSADALEEALLVALNDEGEVPDALLPSTGVPLDIERALAKVFIRTADGRYGTRCSTVVVTERTATGCRTQVVERSFAPDRTVLSEQRFVLEGWPLAATGASR